MVIWLVLTTKSGGVLSKDEQSPLVIFKSFFVPDAQKVPSVTFSTVIIPSLFLYIVPEIKLLLFLIKKRTNHYQVFTHNKAESQ